MPRDTRRYLLVLALLTVAVLAVLFISRQEALLGQALSEQGFLFVTDIDKWRRTDREMTLRADYDFSPESDLNEIPLQIGEWQGHDVPQTNLEVFILLDPEQYVSRYYTRPADNRFLWFTLIGSHKSKSFHPPEICYGADGWQTDVSSAAIPLGDDDFYALQVVSNKEGQAHIVLYFFLWSDYSRDPAAGWVLFKVTAPLQGTTVDETLDVEREFIQEFFAAAVPVGG